jgi:lipoprotein-anchoring transpeptidase ErfK/SrfK
MAALRYPARAGLAIALAVLSGPPAGAQRIQSCGRWLDAQVLLDRRGFSPGEIDGDSGRNTARALAAFQGTQLLDPTGHLDCATWDALLTDRNPVLTDYTVTQTDVDGPFTPVIPETLAEQASLDSLGYRSIVERLAERFHASPRLLERLNPHRAFEPGVTLRVPAVTAFDPGAGPPAPDPLETTVEVSSAESSLRLVRADGTIVFFAPVTSGSEHDPLPLGEWRVNGSAWMPPFRYNPDLFWDADPGHTKAVIKPGPNNPVGVVWIDVNVDHYGIHGTPEPAKIGYAQSHGCVRLTNWDAARVAAIVRPGTRVVFR